MQPRELRRVAYLAPFPSGTAYCPRALPPAYFRVYFGACVHDHIYM